MKKPPSIRSQILNEPCDEFTRLREILKLETTIKENSSRIAQHVAELVAARDKAFNDFHKANTVKSFESYSAALAAHHAANEAFAQVAQIFNRSQAHFQETENILALRAALRVARDRLARRIESLNNEEVRRLAEAGIDANGCEHPAITNLKSWLAGLAEQILYSEDFVEARERGESLGAFRWQLGADLLKP